MPDHAMMETINGEARPLIKDIGPVTVLSQYGSSEPECGTRQTHRTGDLDEQSGRNYYEFKIRNRGSVRINLTSFNIFLTIMTVLGKLLMVITRPLFLDTMIKSGSTDEYSVLFFTTIWFPVFFFGLVVINKVFDPDMVLRPTVRHRILALSGALNALNLLMIMYASDSSRTSPQLQAILGTSVIPFTVICRYIILKKGVSFSRLVCTGIVLIGLFISLEPVIFDIDQDRDGVGDEVQKSGYNRFIWPLIFTLSFIPLGILNAILETELKADETEFLVFQAWVEVYSVVFITAFFWTDFIPGFGAAKTPAEFWTYFTNGFDCMFGRTAECQDAVLQAFLYIMSYCIANMFIYLLIQYAESSVYMVIVQALATPLGAFFWTLFQPLPFFHWDPVFNLATAFVLGGLVIMVPAVVMYNYFGVQEERRAKEQQLDIQQFD